MILHTRAPEPYSFNWSWDQVFNRDCNTEHCAHTATVANVLKEAGYDVQVRVRDPYRAYISRVRKDGADVLPRTVVRGKREVRDGLPAHLVRYLDNRCGA
ncbi:MAG TPA: hypothetical protein VNZ57_15050 [Longimicrobiales bacterium]|nr:hypothetical protein [Longimicrobiales bacterium]